MSLLIRSFVEQEIDLDFSTVAGLEKVRLFPPGGSEDPLALYMPSAAIKSVFEHRRALKMKFPELATNNISELPNEVQFRHAVPEVIRRIVSSMQKGVSLQELESRQWLDTAAWKFEY